MNKVDNQNQVNNVYKEIAKQINPFNIFLFLLLPYLFGFSNTIFISMTYVTFHDKNLTTNDYLAYLGCIIWMLFGTKELILANMYLGYYLILSNMKYDWRTYYEMSKKYLINEIKTNKDGISKNIFKILINMEVLCRKIKNNVQSYLKNVSNNKLLVNAYGITQTIFDETIYLTYNTSNYIIANVKEHFIKNNEDNKSTVTSFGQST